jgi:hypothetical protein
MSSLPRRLLRVFGGLGIVVVACLLWIAVCFVTATVAALLLASPGGELESGWILAGAALAFIGIFPVSVLTIRRLRRDGARVFLRSRSAGAGGVVVIVLFIAALVPAPSIWQAGTTIDQPGGGGLQSLSCASDHFCATFDWAGRLFVWNGHSWSRSPADLVHNLDEPIDLSCVSADLCEIANDAGQVQAFNHVSGNWTTLVGDVQSISSISCASRSFCVAVGGGDALVFDGATSKLLDIAAPTTGGDLNVVSCTSSTFCAVAGDSAAIFNGHSWKLSSLPASSGAGISQISCVRTSCVAIAFDGSSFEYDNGAWHAIGATGAGSQNIGYTPRMLSCPSVGLCYFAATSGVLYELEGTRWSRLGYLFRESWLRRLFEAVSPTPALSLSCPRRTLCVATDGGGIAYVAHLRNPD